MPSRRGESLLKFCVCSSISPPSSPPPPPSPSPQPQQPPAPPPSPQPPPPPPGLPPKAFLCPISGRLFADPVIIVPSGHTFERACIQACQELSFTPPILSSSSASSSSASSSSPSFPFFPNTTLKNYILNWCDRTRHPHPVPVSLDEARAIVKSLKDGNQESSSSSSAAAAAAAADPFEVEFLMTLMEPGSCERELALKKLIQIISTNRGRGISLCSPRIMAAIIPVLKNPEHWRVQIFASATVAAFSQLPANGTKMIQFGAVPPLVDVLANGHEQARANAVTAIYNLAIDKRNMLAIGAMGAIPPLLEKFLDRFVVGGTVAAQALHLLTHHCPENLAILANTEAVVPRLLVLAADKSKGEGDHAISVRKLALMLLCNLAEASKGRRDLIDAGAVELMVRLMREGCGGQDKYCLAVMYRICMSRSAIFKGLARASGAEAVLSVEKVEWGEWGRDMARKMLQVIREDHKGKAVAN